MKNPKLEEFEIQESKDLNLEHSHVAVPILEQEVNQVIEASMEIEEDPNMEILNEIVQLMPIKSWRI